MATIAKESTTASATPTPGEYVCLIVDSKSHIEPLTFTGKHAKQAWAIHRSKTHGIKSERGRAKTNKATTKKKATTTTRTTRTTKAAKRSPLSFRVSPSILFSVEFAPMRVARAEIDADGMLNLYDEKGQRMLSGRATAALR